MVENQIPKSNNDVICVHSVSMNTKSSDDIGANTVAEVQLKNVIDIEKIAEAIIPKAIDLTTRTSQRISNEKKVIEDLLLLLKGFNSNLKVMPFGSATYGFGGPDTNFNICLVNKGDKFLLQFHIIIVTSNFIQTTHQKKYCVDKFRNIAADSTDAFFEKFVAFFKSSVVKKFFRFFRSVNGDRVQKNRIHASHYATKLVCVIQIDNNGNIIESSQIIRDCLLKDPVCKYSPHK